VPIGAVSVRRGAQPIEGEAENAVDLLGIGVADRGDAADHFREVGNVDVGTDGTRLLDALQQALPGTVDRGGAGAEDRRVAIDICEELLGKGTLGRGETDELAQPLLALKEGSKSAVLTPAPRATCATVIDWKPLSVQSSIIVCRIRSRPVRKGFPPSVIGASVAATAALSPVTSIASRFSFSFLIPRRLGRFALEAHAVFAATFLVSFLPFWSLYSNARQHAVSAEVAGVGEMAPLGAEEGELEVARSARLLTSSP
jgi:hypothetical protein